MSIATAKPIDADDRFRPGDPGRRDECGCFVSSGRLKDVLEVGGENVSSLRDRIANQLEGAWITEAPRLPERVGRTA
jgi:acyl-CoA synthetase (AMP-forming)/AMP-acid ligase II